jgi:arylsulfatase A-like enzyme/Flp pilus assembly protein TadD
MRKPATIWPCAAVFALAALAALAGCAKEDERPSLLVVIVDTLRADYLGCYGATAGATPNMDGLAAQGARFSTCVSPVPVTLPSISTILTSAFPPYHGVRDNGLFTLDPSLVTVAEVFQDAGYATCAVVGAYVVSRGTGIEQGFDHFDSEFGGDYARQSSLEPERAGELAKTQRRAGEVTDLAVEWLNQRRRPFMMVAHYFDPHSPYDPPPEFGRRFSESVYLGEVGYTDSEVGRLVRAAREASGGSGLIVALVADHGEGLGEHGEEQHGYFVYDSTLLVPFIVVFPHSVPAGLVVDGQVSTADLAPTVTRLAGLSAPEVWQGRSLAGEITGGGRKPADRPCYIETYRSRYSYNWSELVGIRYTGWKMIRAPKPELYNLLDDPKELENLYEAMPGKAAELDGALDELLASVEGPFKNLRPAESLDETQVRMLETLGYVMPKKAVPDEPLPDPKDMVAKLNTRFESTRLSEEAKRLAARGDLAGAEELLLRAIELNPKSAVAHHDLGRLYFEAGDREGGLELMERAAGLTETEAVPHLNLALTYMQLGRHADAFVEFEKAITIEPDHVLAHHKYGNALETEDRFDEALEQYYRCLELDPDMRQAQFDAAVILARTGRSRQAAQLLEDLIRKNPSDELANTARKMLGRAQ